MSDQTRPQKSDASVNYNIVTGDISDGQSNNPLAILSSDETGDLILKALEKVGSEAKADITTAERAAKCAERVINVTPDLDAIEKINPRDVYDKKNEAISQADIPLEEKLRLYDANHDKYMEDTVKAEGILDKIRNNKIIAFGKTILLGALAVAVGYGGCKMINSSTDDDTYDSNGRYIPGYLEPEIEPEYDC